MGHAVVSCIAITFVAMGLQEPGARTERPVKPRSGATAAADPAAAERVAQAFARAFQRALASGDRARVNALVDWDAIVDRATKGFSIPPQSLREMRAGIMKSMQKPEGVAGQWVDLAKAGWRTALLRKRTRSGHPAALIRLTAPMGTGGSVNYVEFLLRREPGGEPRAIDFYGYMSGELLSETLRRGLLPLAAELSRGFLDKLVGTSSDYIQDMPRLAEVAQAVARGENPRALELIRQLRPGTLKEKNVLLIKIRALQDQDDEAYAAALKEFRERFPNEACVDFLSIDYFVLKADYAKARECVERLDRGLGGDPFLDVIRGNLEVAENRPDEAHRLYLQAVKREPELVEGYVALADESVRAKDHDRVVEWLKKVESLAPGQIKGILAREEYAEFVASPQHQKWHASLKEKGTLPVKPGTRKRAPQDAPSP